MLKITELFYILTLNNKTGFIAITGLNRYVNMLANAPTIKIFFLVIMDLKETDLL